MSTSNGLNSGYMYRWHSLLPVNEGVSHPRADTGFFQGVLGVIAILFIYIYTYIYIYIYICIYIAIYIHIYCNYSHYYFNQQSACIYLLCMKLQPTCCCSCSCYALMLLYICTIIYSLAWPDLGSHRGAIACNSAYAASNNAPM